jgi:hypothetical protein
MFVAVVFKEKQMSLVSDVKDEELRMLMNHLFYIKRAGISRF